MEIKIFELAKEYKIKMKELENEKMSLSLLYKIRSGKTPMKENIYPY